MWGMKGVALATVVLAVGLGPNSKAEATVYHPATNPIDGDTWSTTPAYAPANSWYSDKSNADIGNQSPGNVELSLETATWIGVPLTFVSGGACGSFGVACTESTKSGSWTSSGTAAKVFGIHFGNNFIALLFADALTSFSISGLPHGVSNIYAHNLNAVPLPGALWLMGTVLAGWAATARLWRRQWPMGALRGEA